MTANANYRLKDSLSRCTAKALVLVGSRERPVMKKSAVMIAQRLPSARVQVLNGLGHGELSINHGWQYADMLLRLLEE